MTYKKYGQTKYVIIRGKHGTQRGREGQSQTTTIKVHERKIIFKGIPDYYNQEEDSEVKIK